MPIDELSAACRRIDAALPRLDATHIIELIENRLFPNNYETESSP